MRELEEEYKKIGKKVGASGVKSSEMTSLEQEIQEMQEKIRMAEIEK